MVMTTSDAATTSLRIRTLFTFFSLFCHFRPGRTQVFNIIPLAPIDRAMAGPIPLTERVRRTYERDGLAGIVRAAPGSILERTLRPLHSAETAVVFHAIQEDILRRDELRRRAQDEGRFVTTGSSESVSIEPSPAGRTLPPALSAHVGSYETKRPFVAEISDARLIWPGALALSHDQAVVLESIENSAHLLRDRINWAIRDRGSVQVLFDLGLVSALDSVASERLGRVFPLVRHPTTNYFNWIAGYLPKIRSLERYIEETGMHPEVLVSADAPSWEKESLELVGVAPESITWWSGGPASVEQLLVPFHRLPFPAEEERPRIPTPAECRFLRERVTDNLPDADGLFSSRVFVSRRNATDRRIVNNPAVSEYLETMGFEEYVLEDMAFGDQVRLFEKADLVIGAHGAGLTNLVFADDPSVIELFPADDVRYTYFCLSRQLGYDYDFLLCDPDGVNIDVDVTSLADATEAAIARRRS